MRKISMVIVALTLFITGCAPNFQKDQEIVQETDNSKKTAIIPKYKISDQYYQTILPFEPSEARGLTVRQLNTRFDMDEFETGLMRIALNSFDSSKFLFQEGQYLDKSTVQSWLNRKYTDAQVAERGIKPGKNVGLNPINNSAAGEEEAPIYLAHLLEHNYLLREDDGKARLGGVVIGLALNTVYSKDGTEKKFTLEELEKEGKLIAQEVLNRLRQLDDVASVPITIALFAQESKSSIVPGNFIAYANAAAGSAKLGSWASVNEDYMLFPSDAAKAKYRDDLTTFQKFKEDVEEYFPNFNGVIGRAFYVEEQLQELSITIPIQFYGKAETIGFTQYVAGLIIEHFPTYISIEISVTSVNGPEALIVRKANQENPFVHIYS